MKKVSLLLSLMAWVLLLHVQAQAPAGYYAASKGTNGSKLKTALFNIIANHTECSYNQLWEDFKKTDLREDGKIWDMYSSITNYRPGTDQAGNYKEEGDVYNREHSFPKSWFNDAKPMFTDLFHIVPTDGYVNGRRSNYPFGETNGEKWQSSGGFSKLGSCTVSGYSGIVFEPNDEYKGDFARIYFYMATAYEDQIANWNSDMLSHNSYPAYANWALEMLLRWAAEDPVSKKEIARNNEVYKIQKNRNPYVDYPGLEQYVWGNKTTAAFDPDNYEGGDIPVGPHPGNVTKPTFSPEGGMVHKGTKVSITCETEGASICYSIDNGIWQSNTPPIEITVNESTSVSAYATKGETKSEMVTATYTITTNPAEGGVVYKLITSNDELIAGKRYLVVCTEASTALSQQCNDIRSQVPVTVDPDKSFSTKVNAEGLPYSLLLNRNDNHWTLLDESCGLYLALNKDDNKLHTATTVTTGNAQWSISVGTNGATAIANRNYSNRLIRYNKSSPRFACYRATSSMAPVSLFVEMDATGIDELKPANGQPIFVINLQGHVIRKTNSMRAALQGLPQGIYIVNGVKVLVK